MEMVQQWRRKGKENKKEPARVVEPNSVRNGSIQHPTLAQSRRWKREYRRGGGKKTSIPRAACLKTRI